MRRAFVVVVVLALGVASSILGTACSSSSTKRGTLVGHLRVAGPFPHLRTVDGKVVAQGNVTLSAIAKANSGFVLRLPAGSYELNGTTTYIAGGGNCSASGTVVVTASKTSRMDVICNIK